MYLEIYVYGKKNIYIYITEREREREGGLKRPTCLTDEDIQFLYTCLMLGRQPNL